MVFQTNAFSSTAALITFSTDDYVSVHVCQVTLLTRYWTKFNLAALCVSLALFFICSRITHNARLFEKAPADYFFVGVSDRAFVNPVVWLTALLTTCTAVLPSMTARALNFILTSHDKHKVHSTQHQPVEMRSKFRRGRFLRRSSYALSQGPGPGHLIPSRTSFHSTAPPVDEKVTTTSNSTDLQNQLHFKENSVAPANC
ncbi:hypothetical protein LDENG_00016170 [Lucifuga dentata]|nr:hypothetical protein LDENG_00016170 [Lucifuga dentata]